MPCTRCDAAHYQAVRDIEERYKPVYWSGQCLYNADGRIKEAAVKLLEYVAIVAEKILDKVQPDRLASQHALAEDYIANEQL
ncbi:hypothetical protein OIDMADRAFT_116758 [Oidiodendron maius Zn]|uniref:Uncharacterized protein n=1 Tax=Oidiodendron maius (strain Zn) TaxID=913774 RepID=A0A0C3HM17_OIDMZ|nr:hypothetical protein OIDMADRAFT_116758 [Oidiodendron maius Zn]